MEISTQSQYRENNSLIVITHLSQLLCYVTGFGSLLVPLILWLTSKDSVIGMDVHGRAALNLQLSLLVYLFVSIPAILLLGLGLLGILGVVVIGFVLPILNAIRAANGETPSYFLTIPFLGK